MHKVVCGHDFSGLLTTEGQVFTWGLNDVGQLGIADEKIHYMTCIDHRKPLNFVDQSQNSNKRKQSVVDLAAGLGQMIALTDQQQVYVWGDRMGIYPGSLELTLNSVE